MRTTGTVTGTLALAGVGAVGALVALAVATGRPGLAVPSALPAAFLVAGAIGGRARPDHRGVQMLLAVGSLHLLAFAESGWVAADGRPSGTTAWALGLLAVACYGAGFVALALLLATYPDGRLGSPGLRRFGALCVTVLLVVLLAEAMFANSMPMVLSPEPVSVPAPGPLPVASLPFDLQPLLPLLVVAGAAVLVVRSRRAPTELRRQLEWATLAGAVLALLLLATPAASAIVPSAVWALVFVTTMSLVPFALLGGLVRHRLLDVDLLVVRTLARGVMLVAVLSLYAVAAVALGRSGPLSGLAPVALTLVAAVSGGPLLRRGEALADRWFTGGRVRRGALMDELGATLAASDPEQLPDRVCATLREGLDIAWVRLVLGGTVTLQGTVAPGQQPELSAPLLAGGERLGALECGPRRGGWGRAEQTRLDRVARQVALALRDLELSRELAARVEELTSSRARLVRAEETVRRQVERDLHDGVQQQLVALLARLSVVRALLDPGSPASGPLDVAQDLARDVLVDLRRLVAGIHPALLGDRGLTAAVEARAGLLPITVAVDADPRIVDTRFAPEVEGAAFFVVSEALANVMKHSGSDRARVVLSPLPDGGLRVAVADEGRGTASYDGTGLAGLRDRVEALGGRFTLQATPAVGTTVLAEFAATPTLVGSDV